MTARDTLPAWPCDEAYLIDGYAGIGPRAKPFCAVIGFRGDTCTFAAPILRRLALGKSKRDVRALIRWNQWKVLG